MELKFSHIDILVKDLQTACDYYQKTLNAQISKTFTWMRDDLHVVYAVVKMNTEHFMLVQPFPETLKICWIPKEKAQFIDTATLLLILKKLLTN